MTVFITFARHIHSTTGGHKIVYTNESNYSLDAFISVWLQIIFQEEDDVSLL